MHIFISGSMAFAQDMVKVKKELEELRHNVELPFETELHLEKPEFVDSLEENLQYCIDNDVITKSFDSVAASDAILVLNLHRKGIKGYIGTSTLMEIAIAYYLKKKIFLFNPIPHFDEVRWAHEISIMQPTIINGDVTKIQ